MRRLAHRLFTSCSAVSLLLCVAVCVLWLIGSIAPREFTSRSVQRHGTMLVRGYGGFGWNGVAAGFFRYEDHILFGQRYDEALKLVGEPTKADEAQLRRSEAAESQQSPGPLDFDDGSFRYERRDRLEHFSTGGRNRAYGRKTVVVVPFHQLAIATGILPLIRLGARATRGLRKRRLPGACPACGYDLRATPERCPECGAAATSHQGTSRRGVAPTENP